MTSPVGLAAAGSANGSGATTRARPTVATRVADQWPGRRRGDGRVTLILLRGGCRCPVARAPASRVRPAQRSRTYADHPRQTTCDSNRCRPRCGERQVAGSCRFGSIPTEWRGCHGAPEAERVVAMEKRRLGRLEHQSSVLIYGAAALGEVSQDVADRSIQEALDGGINHFDV